MPFAELCSSVGTDCWIIGFVLRSQQWGIALAATFCSLFCLCSFSWQIFKNASEAEVPFWSDIVLGFRPMSAAELQKFPQHSHGQAFTTLKCDCPPYLLWLEKRLVWGRMGVQKKSPGGETGGGSLRVDEIGEGKMQQAGVYI